MSPNSKSLPLVSHDRTRSRVTRPRNFQTSNFVRLATLVKTTLVDHRRSTTIDNYDDKTLLKARTREKYLIFSNFPKAHSIDWEQFFLHTRHSKCVNIKGWCHPICSWLTGDHCSKKNLFHEFWWFFMSLLTAKTYDTNGKDFGQ